jgi:hypothetical protein
LSWDEGSAPLTRRAASIGPAGVSPPAVTTLSVAAAALPPTARLVPAPARGDAVLVDVAGSAIAVRLVAGGVAGPAALVPIAGTGRRIEAAVALHDGEVVVMLLSGGAEVVAVALDAAGAVWSTAVLPLPGDVTPAPRYFSRDLAAHGRRAVLAATTAGVHRVRVAYDAAGVHLTPAAGFDGAALRGPIAVLDPPP